MPIKKKIIVFYVFVRKIKIFVSFSLAEIHERIIPVERMPLENLYRK